MIQLGFDRLLTLAQAYVEIYEGPDETLAEFTARFAGLMATGPKVVN